MKKGRIDEFENNIKRDYENIAGIVISRDNKVVYENYFNECNDKSSIHVYSVSKSIISILIGIAIDKRLIKDVNQKVMDFFPEYKIKKKENIFQEITIKDLLTMSAPYKYKFTPFTYMRYFMSKDWVEFSLNLLGSKKQIGNFNYTPLVGPDILSGILVKATGKSVFDFATENLFEPLAITVEKSILLKSMKEQTAFNKAKDISGWVIDPQGINAGGWGLTLSPRDMTKIGQLYLNDGFWNKKQIVSTSWIVESTKEHNRWKEMNLAYGYLWWVLDKEKQAYAAMGDGGNVIYFNRKKGIVVSIASLFKQNAKDRLVLIKEHIIPMLEDVNNECAIIVR